MDNKNTYNPSDTEIYAEHFAWIEYLNQREVPEE